MGVHDPQNERSPWPEYALGAAMLPEEIETLSLGRDKTTLTWCATPPLAGTGTVHDVPRGSLDEFAVGTGAAEICLPPGSFPTQPPPTPPFPQRVRASGTW